MNWLRRFGFAAWLALALVVGQQAVLVHDLGHAVEKRQAGVPAEKGCDTHYLCAQLGNAVGASAPVIAQEATGRLVHQFVEAQGGAQRARLAYRSQAPPTHSRPA